MSDIEKIYRDLQQGITTEVLTRLSVSLINAHRENRRSVLASYVGSLFPENKNEIETAYRLHDSNTLKGLSEILRCVPGNDHYRKTIYDVDVREEYRYGEEDFGFDFSDEEEAGTWEEDQENEKFDFIAALKSAHLGNIDYTLRPSDLDSLEGELHLAGYDIGDLRGLEFCCNITFLDLSDNNIDNIHEVQSLGYLK